MKKFFLLAFMMFAMAGFTMAQNHSPKHRHHHYKHHHAHHPAHHK